MEGGFSQQKVLILCSLYTLSLNCNIYFLLSINHYQPKCVVSIFHDILLFYGFDLGIINQYKKLHTNMYYPI